MSSSRQPPPNSPSIQSRHVYIPRRNERASRARSRRRRRCRRRQCDIDNLMPFYKLYIACKLARRADYRGRSFVLYLIQSPGIYARVCVCARMSWYLCTMDATARMVTCIRARDGEEEFQGRVVASVDGRRRGSPTWDSRYGTCQTSRTFISATKCSM